MAAFPEPRQGPAHWVHAAVRRHSGAVYALVGALLAAAAVGRVALTYHVFNSTYDEPIHVAAGMAWLDKGDYNVDWLHPPLARVALATGPYLAGLRFHPLPDAVQEGNAILYAGGAYLRNLTLARIGNLPFLLLACCVILLWARRWFSRSAGLWALLLFVSVPPILGHAGLATLDMACAATVVLALYRFMRWIELPSLARSAVFGASLGMAFLTKFSSLLFVPACCFVACACLWLGGRGSKIYFRLYILRGVLAAGVALVVLWAGYRFSLQPMSANPRIRPFFEQTYPADTPLRRIVSTALDAPVPLAQALGGLAQLAYHDRVGKKSYLFGEFRMTGWWYFFPAVLALKTPLGFLALGIGGLAAALWKWKRAPWQLSLTAIFPLALLLVCMPSRIDLGVRHILALYPLLALMGGYAISAALQSGRRLLAGPAVLLACATVMEAALAHPDYLAYFNQLGGSHPEKLLSESDLDWGQDLNRLSQRLRALGVKEAAIGYFGTASLDDAGLPKYRELSPADPSTGYVAASVRLTTLEYAADGSYGWLKRYRPIERVGKSIDLYRIGP